MNNSVMATVQQIHSQLLWSIDMNVYFSWGVSKLIATTYQDMPTLCMKVSGAIHKGWVYISLNEGKDLYEVRLVNDLKKVTKFSDDVYADDLGALIDSLIERPDGMSDEEYGKIAFEDSMKKCSI